MSHVSVSGDCVLFQSTSIHRVTMTMTTMMSEIVVLDCHPVSLVAVFNTHVTSPSARLITLRMLVYIGTSAVFSYHLFYSEIFYTLSFFELQWSMVIDYYYYYY